MRPRTSRSCCPPSPARRRRAAGGALRRGPYHGGLRAAAARRLERALSRRLRARRGPGRGRGARGRAALQRRPRRSAERARRGRARRGDHVRPHRRRAGGVAAVRGVRNPVVLARAVMETHATRAACRRRCRGARRARGRRARRPRLARRGAAREPSGAAGDTIGAVAVDADGHVAAATSTGGIRAEAARTDRRLADPGRRALRGGRRPARSPPAATARRSCARWPATGWRRPSRHARAAAARARCARALGRHRGRGRPDRGRTPGGEPAIEFNTERLPPRDRATRTACAPP